MTEVRHYDKGRVGSQEDYQALARLAEETGREFLELVERFESGGEAVEGIAASLRAWIGHDEVEQLVPGIYEAVRMLRPNAVRRKRGGGRGAGSGAGARWLWYGADLAHIAQIRGVCGLSTRDALRAFEAIRRGVL